eukprot:6467555-Amphidinium_carterae.5
MGWSSSHSIIISQQSRTCGVAIAVKDALKMQPLWSDTQGRATLAAVTWGRQAVLFATVYLPVGDVLAGEATLKELAEEVASYGLVPVFICGDLNSGPEAFPTLNLMLQRGWQRLHSGDRHAVRLVELQQA